MLIGCTIMVFDAILTARQNSQKIKFLGCMGRQWQKHIFPKLNFTQFGNCNVKITTFKKTCIHQI